MKETRTVIIYRCTSAERRQLGQPDTYTLEEPRSISRIWYDPEVYILPDGFTSYECVDGDKSVFNLNGEYCCLTPGYNNLPVLIDSMGVHPLKKPLPCWNRTTAKRPASNRHKTGPCLL